MLYLLTQVFVRVRTLPLLVLGCFSFVLFREPLFLSPRWRGLTQPLWSLVSCVLLSFSALLLLLLFLPFLLPLLLRFWHRSSTVAGNTIQGKALPCHPCCRSSDRSASPLFTARQLAVAPSQAPKTAWGMAEAKKAGPTVAAALAVAAATVAVARPRVGLASGGSSACFRTFLVLPISAGRCPSPVPCPRFLTRRRG